MPWLVLVLQFLELVKLEGRNSFSKEGETFLLQLCTCPDIHSAAAAQLVFAPVDAAAAAADVPLLPSGFRVIPVDTEELVSGRWHHGGYSRFPVPPAFGAAASFSLCEMSSKSKAIHDRDVHQTGTRVGAYGLVVTCGHPFNESKCSFGIVCLLASTPACLSPLLSLLSASSSCRRLTGCGGTGWVRTAWTPTLSTRCGAATTRPSAGSRC